MRRRFGIGPLHVFGFGFGLVRGMAFPTVPWHPRRLRARRRPAAFLHLHTLSRVWRRFSLNYDTVADMTAGVLGIIDVACTEVPRRPPYTLPPLALHVFSPSLPPLASNPHLPLESKLAAGDLCVLALSHVRSTS